MLLVAHSVIIKTDGDFGKMAPHVMEVSEEQAEDRDESYRSVTLRFFKSSLFFSDEEKNKFVRECISNPLGPRTVDPNNVDPFIV